MKEEAFRVQEIHCDGCERAIRNSLSGLDGVRVIEPDQGTDEVKVGYEETKVGRDQIVERLTAAGFPLAE